MTGPDPEADPEGVDPRLSLNQITTRRWSLEQAVAGCAAAGLGWVGLWREHVAACGLERARKVVDEAGLRVSSLCRGGFFPASDPDERRHRRDDTRRAVDEAAALGTDVLVLVCGGLPDGVGLDAAREQVAAGIADVAPYAADHGVRLAIEPLHPMVCADRSVVVTLAQALDLAEQFPADQVGVTLDTFNVWWDPELASQIARAGSRIHCYQIGDWLDPLPDVVLGRGLPGDGVIDLAAVHRRVTAAGYDGPVEVEIFNQELWDTPGDVVVRQVVERYDRHVR